MNENALHFHVGDGVDGFFVEDGIAFHNDLVTFDGNNFTGILVNEVFYPCAEYAGSEALANVFAKGFFITLYFVGHAEEFEDVFICFVTDSTEQGGYGEFFLTVDVCVHHVVDVGSKFHPRTFEGDNAGGINLGAVRVNGLTEEYTG